MDFDKLFKQLDSIKNPEHAVDISRKLVREFPDRDDSWHSLYWNIGLMLEEAAESQAPISQNNELIIEMTNAWKKYMSFVPRDYNTCWNMAGFLETAKRYREAAEIYLKAAELEKEYGDDEEVDEFLRTYCYYHSADCHKVLGNYDEALRMIDAAITIDETIDYFWKFKADILQNMGRPEEAKQASARSYELREKEDVTEGA